MARGGPRPGAGRPKGSKNKKTIEKAVIRKAAAEENMTPLEYMLRIMRDENADPEVRARMAYYAAPYVHPKAGVKTGVKAEREERAKQAGTGRFSPSEPPKLNVVK
ncbi:hypothetical protein [Desulfobacter sp.]|uniref:hypothetical protein n=1 Tax=Desulfobacter sp. TaxID=2294 RepID=UPI003D095B95